MKQRKTDWKLEAAWYQRLTAALVYKIGGEQVTITREEIMQAREKGLEVANINGNISLRIPERHRPRIVIEA
jgi:hypothetical protein